MSVKAATKTLTGESAAGDPLGRGGEMEADWLTVLNGFARTKESSQRPTVLLPNPPRYGSRTRYTFSRRGIASSARLSSC